MSPISRPRVSRVDSQLPQRSAGSSYAMFLQFYGADGEIRTHDLPLTRRLLCQLSYVGVSWMLPAIPCTELRRHASIERSSGSSRMLSRSLSLRAHSLRSGCSMKLLLM